MNPWTIGMLAVLALFAALSVSIAAAMLKIAFMRQERKTPLKPEQDVYYPFRERVQEGLDWYADQPVEELWIRSCDGLRLYGRLLPREEAKGTILMMHGYHGDALTDFAAVMRFCHEAGYRLLIPDERAHGQSEGKYISFGVRERHDVLAWLAALNARFGAEEPLFLYGLSMGCSTVLAAAGLGLPDNVRGIVADCGYTRPWDICAHVLRSRMRLPVFPILHIAALFTRLFGGFGLRQASAPRAMRRNRRPVLFFHGAKDDFVPFWMGNANYAACVAEKEQVVVAEAGHAQSFLMEPERCLEALGAFLSRHTEAAAGRDAGGG
ncbi:MAG: alpha/beta hydrolase [Clostridia bacterium]|nr:alpha/beta hydrolase [Clostridia bacterium]